MLLQTAHPALHASMQPPVVMNCYFGDCQDVHPSASGSTISHALIWIVLVKIGG